ncbi:MAG: AAA family ATPase, partial [Elusimicrobiota bacterium]
FDDEIMSQSSPGKKKWVCFDEIHKMPKWKDILKDFFDSFEQRYQFIVTGSARLDLFRRSGDSLAGRYFTFHLNPICLREFIGNVKKNQEPRKPLDFIMSRIERAVYKQKELNELLALSGFPEPLNKGTARFYVKWHRDYLDRIVREDMRDLTKIMNLENIFALMHMLPQRVGSPLSINSLSNDMLLGYKVVRNLIHALELMFMVFLIRPWHKRINRSIRKEPKLYFYDWTHIKDESLLYENFMAMELKNMVDIWSDNGYGDFNLFYVRTKDGKETDFLITKYHMPWLLCEAKLKSAKIESHHYRISELLGNIPFVQIVKEDKITQQRDKIFFQVSASRFFL